MNRASIGLVILAWGTLAIAFERAPTPEEELGSGTKLDEAAALEISQAAVGQPISRYQFHDRLNQPISFDQFRGRPLIISLIYTSCYHTCSTLTTHLSGVLEVARDALGEDSFSVVTIGFDSPVDTPERMRVYALERGIDEPGWHFLSADKATIDGLTADLGFVFFSSPKGFDHLAQTTVLDAEGRVYRQVYGQEFQPPALVEPLKELVFGTRAESATVSGWINGVRLFCTVYDPSTGRYKFDYSIFVAIATGVLSLGAIGVFIVHAWRDKKTSGKAA